MAAFSSDFSLGGLILLRESRVSLYIYFAHCVVKSAARIQLVKGL